MLSVKTRKIRNRAATAFRVAAQSLHHSQSFLGRFYRRTRPKLGAPKAITTTVHKLARIIYHMVTTGYAWDENHMRAQRSVKPQSLEARHRKKARELD